MSFLVTKVLPRIQKAVPKTTVSGLTADIRNINQFVDFYKTLNSQPFALDGKDVLTGLVSVGDTGMVQYVFDKGDATLMVLVGGRNLLNVDGLSQHDPNMVLDVIMLTGTAMLGYFVNEVVFDAEPRYEENSTNIIWVMDKVVRRKVTRDNTQTVCIPLAFGAAFTAMAVKYSQTMDRIYSMPSLSAFRGELYYNINQYLSNGHIASHGVLDEVKLGIVRSVFDKLSTLEEEVLKAVSTEEQLSRTREFVAWSKEQVKQLLN